MTFSSKTFSRIGACQCLIVSSYCDNIGNSGGPGFCFRFLYITDGLLNTASTHDVLPSEYLVICHYQCPMIIQEIRE